MPIKNKCISFFIIFVLHILFSAVNIYAYQTASKTHTTYSDFNGLSSQVVINGASSPDNPAAGSIVLEKGSIVIETGTGLDGSFDVSKGNTLNGGCTKHDNGTTRSGTSWSGTTCTINTSIKSTWNFSNVTIPSGTTLTATGSKLL